tara:strand:+ start:88 stop:819 length:732 start_codon:yes stop_codon:yes gene_type:complete
MQNMLVFHNGGDTSYANYASNLSSMSSVTTAVTLRFASTVATAVANDSVVLTVTAGKEEEVMEALAFAMTNATSGMTVIADDQNSVYYNPGITALASVAVDNGAGQFKNVIVGLFDGSGAAGSGMDTAHNMTFTNAQSGSLVTVPTTGAASTITLPTAPIDGFNLEFVCEAASGSAHEIEIAGAFEGNVHIVNAVVLLDNTSDVTIGAGDFEIGDQFRIIYSGSAGGYKIDGTFITAAAITAS